MISLRAQFASLATSPEDISGEAFTCFNRAALDARLRRVRFGALGLECPDDSNPKTSAVLGWPGAAAFPGAARVELPAAGGLVQTLPIEDLRVGAIALTLPVLVTHWAPPPDAEPAEPASGKGPPRDDPLLRDFARGVWLTEAIDIVFCDPRDPRHWARRTGLAVFLGREPAQNLLPTEDPVRLHATPLAWFRALAAAQAAGSPHYGCALLDPAAFEAERLLLGPPLICDDEVHAEAVRALQKEARERLTQQLPKPGKLYLARAHEVKAA